MSVITPIVLSLLTTLRTRNNFFFVDCPYTSASPCAYSNFFMFRYPQNENVSLFIDGASPFFADDRLLSVHDGDAISALGTWTVGPRPAALDPVPTDPSGAPVPEPATLALLGTGLVAARLRRRVRKG